MRVRELCLCLIWLYGSAPGAFAVAAGEGGPATDAAPASPEEWVLAPSGSLTYYALTNSAPRFGGEARSWMETSARLGLALQHKSFKLALIGIAVNTTGDDPYGTGSPPAGTPPGAPAPALPPDFGLDEAYVLLTNPAALPVKITLGRQAIAVGSQFLIGDGVYDGFAPRTRQAVYHNPRHGFDALRAEWTIGSARLDSFIYRVDPTWDGGGERNGFLGGVDLSRTSAKLKGSYAAGMFYRQSRTDLDNDMTILNLRAEQHQPSRPDLYASGEVALEVGTCRNPAYCTTAGERMKERAWHAEAGYQASAGRLKPFLEVGYVSYSRDFTPVATGFSDWGKWYLGNQIDWIIFGTNSRVLRAAAGVRPHSAVKVQLQYHRTREAVPSGASTGGPLSNEWSLIGEWYPRPWLWADLLVCYSRAGRALGSSGLQNPFAVLNSGAAPVGTDDTLDTVLALGIHF